MEGVALAIHACAAALLAGGVDCWKESADLQCIDAGLASLPGKVSVLVG